MRAVNLIPDESKAGSRSGPAPYVLLGVLAVLVASVAFYVLTSNTIVDRKAQLASLQTQVQAAQAQAEAVRPYREFASLAQARVQTIRQLGEARFDWQRSFSDLSKAIPGNVWLTSLLATVTTGVSVDGGGGSGSTGALRGALPNPAIELNGCTVDHDSVVRLISRLRLMRGVQRVALADSVKGDGDSGGSGGGSGAGAGGDCRHGHPNFPEFDLVVFFDAIPAVPAPPAAGATPTTGGAVPPGSPQGAATPAASTTPAQSTPPAAPPQSTSAAPAAAATTPSSGSAGTGATRGGG